MSKPSTQDIERFYFEKFRDAYPLPDGQIVHGDKPDIILQTDTGTIGIEVTRFYLTRTTDKLRLFGLCAR